MPRWGSVRELHEDGWVECWLRPTDVRDGRESLGIGRWPTDRRDTSDVTVAVAPPIPLRFSLRAAAAGDAQQAEQLRRSENEAIRLCASAAPPRFRAAAWPAKYGPFAVGDEGAMWVGMRGTAESPEWEPDGGAPHAPPSR